MKTLYKIYPWPRLLYFIALCLLVGCQPGTPNKQSDIEALKALDQAYASAWIAGDAEAVMTLFTDDASLVPHHGDTPILGSDAIRAFWFNPDYPPTVIAKWDRKAEEVFVSKNTGVVRGRAFLTWEYNGIRTTIPESNYVLIAERLSEDWKIRLLTWNDDPRKWVQEPITNQD